MTVVLEGLGRSCWFLDCLVYLKTVLGVVLLFTFVLMLSELLRPKEKRLWEVKKRWLLVVAAIACLIGLFALFMFKPLESDLRDEQKTYAQELGRQLDLECQESELLEFCSRLGHCTTSDSYTFEQGTCMKFHAEKGDVWVVD